MVMDEICKRTDLRFRPVVDFSRCEAKGPCAEVCPYDVFEIRQIEPSDYASLGFFSRFKNRVHGGRVSYTPKADQCRACGLCVKACPEQAIELVKASP
jgi:NAD-dependent dihydropyrimidine dehydrogenase PreA subunit